MQAFYQELDKLVGQRTGQCRVVLVGDTMPADPWRTAADSLQLHVLAASTADEADLAINGETPTVAVVPLAAFLDRSSMETAIRWLARTAVVVVADSDPQAALWRLLAWDALTTAEAPEAAAAVLAQAGAEARLRSKRRCMVSSYFARLASLSTDEREVLDAVCGGRLNKQIASDFKVSVRTVEQRRRRVFDKMGIDSAVPLAALTAVVRTLSEQNLRCQRVLMAMPTPSRPVVPPSMAPHTPSSAAYVAMS